MASRNGSATAAPIAPAIADAFKARFGHQIHNIYGLTETTGAVVNLPPADHDPNGPNRHRLRSCGLPGPGVGLRIVNPDIGTDCEQGEVGEIWIRSQQVMLGYWNMPEKTREAFRDGHCTVGDMALRDADGFIRLIDRKKNMIISGGMN